MLLRLCSAATLRLAPNYAQFKGVLRQVAAAAAVTAAATAAAPPTTYQVQPWHYKTQRGFRIGKGGRRPFSSTFYCTFTKQINKKWIFFEFKKRLWPDVILFVAVDVPFFLCIISESNKKEGVPCMSTA